METRLASGTGDARKIRPPRRRWQRRCPPPMSSATSTRWPIGWPRSATTPRRPPPPTGRAGRSTAPRRPPQGGPGRRGRGISANSTQWKAAGDRMRAILDEWRTITGLDRKTDDALWKRYSAARETFNRRRGSHFAELDRERAGAKAAKERLCERAEELSGSTDWAPTAAAFRDLLTEWKAAGRARPRTSTTRCGSGSRPPRTPSSAPATPSARSATPSSRPTRGPRSSCWSRRRSWTRPTSRPPASPSA